ncbi:hypothetical protein RN001_013275 [Aquatica leii]|uniref:HAT C-terminal dimerisation domain-containing protein n=1 Tax=Aquatica leii TaxID=1421715 RepID=A0AAN7SNN7_9COLE|nr:hypothetical protein RN001_013275 [Aquatica leii]
MSQKRPSGSEFRKRKRVREMEAKKMGNTLRKWTVTQPESSQEDVSNDNVLALPGMSGTKSENNLKIKYKEDNPVNPSQQDLTLPITTNINDPVSWLPLTDHIRCFLVEKGPDQGKDRSGVFLSAVDMISKFDPELRAHIESLNKGNISYFTPYIQNELVDILASEVKKQILDDVRAAKYFSILFDSRAVKALNLQIPQIWCVLKILTTNDYNAETISTAKSIMDQINYKFICILQIWDKILESVDKVNVALQSKIMTIDKASELIKGLTSQIQNIRETVDIVFEKAKTIFEQCHIEDNFLEKRRKRVKRHNLSESSDTGYDITQQQNTIISELKWRFEKLRDIQNSFGFLTLKHITTYSVEELKKHAADLSIKYSADINATEFWSEIETLKSQVEATTLFDKCECQSSMGLLKAVVELDLKEMFPNVVVAIKIFLTMPVTVASCERSFSKLKLIKTYLRSTMGQERLSGLAILSIERDIARLLSYENVIKDFAMRKARKVNL